MRPQNKKDGASCQLLQPRHEWDPKRWRTLSPRGWADGGGGGAVPSQGVWGMCPQNKKDGTSCQLLQTCYEWDPNRRRTLSLRGWADGGGGGAAL